MAVPILSEARKNELLTGSFPLRIHAVAFGYIVCHLMGRHPGEQPVYFRYGDAPGTEQIRVPLSGHLLTNAAVSTAIVEACTLLLFLGVKMTNSTQDLHNRAPNNEGVFIEQFKSLGQPLTSLTVERIRQEAASKIPEIEADILAVIKMRNKDVAHLDAEFQNENTVHGMAKVFLLVIHYMEEFYKELGRAPIIHLDQFTAEVDRFVKS